MKTNFTINDIVSEKFNRELNGYSPRQIDNFLDMVVDDYLTFNKQIIHDKESVLELEKIISNQREILSRQQEEINLMKTRLDKYIKKMK